MSHLEGQHRGGALETGLSLIEELAEHVGGLGVTELASRVGVDKANAHRLLHTLQSRGYVAQDPTTRRYSATPQLLTLAGSVLRRLDLRSVADPVCDELAEATGESVHAAALTRSGVVYVLQRRGRFMMSVETEVGTAAPLHCTATGKAVLAHLDEERLRDLVTEPLQNFTFRTHPSLDSLLRDLDRVREIGYAMDDEEFNLGVRCIACPVFGIEGKVVGSVGFSGPTQRVGTDRLAELTELVRNGAAKITTGLGGADASAPRALPDAAAKRPPATGRARPSTIQKTQPPTPDDPLVSHRLPR